MDRIANKNASEYVDNRVPFIANNVFTNKYDESIYIVYSYGLHFPMYVCDIANNYIWYENSDKYSVSTSKQQTQARPTNPNIKMQYKTTQELLAIINNK